MDCAPVRCIHKPHQGLLDQIVNLLQERPDMKTDFEPELLAHKGKFGFRENHKAFRAKTNPRGAHHTFSGAAAGGILRNPCGGSGERAA